MISARAYSHVAIEVKDAKRAQAFYRDVMGVAAEPASHWPEADVLALPLPSGQHLLLAERAEPRVFADTGVHQAYRASKGAIEAIIARAGAAGMEVHHYKEDRPEEVEHNTYFADPDGNRIQLVAGDGPGDGIAAIHHAVVQVSDIEWEDEFWVETMGLKALHRVGWNTGDFVRARAWGEGKEDMAPGTRRWDQRYRDIPGGTPGQSRKVARPNPQLFLGFGEGGSGGSGPVLGIFLAQAHFQEPPPEMTRGTPRVAMIVEEGALEATARALAAAGGNVEGPVAHPKGGPISRSVYLRDRCGVFFEFCSFA